MKPEEVHRTLHNATDWFAIKKVVPKVMLKLSKAEI